MSTATQTCAVLIRKRLDVTGPRSVVEFDEAGATVLVARYGSRQHAHAAANAFLIDHRHHPQNGACIVWPTPGLCITFAVTDRVPRHRLPGLAKQGPRPRHNIRSGRHVDNSREVA